MALRLALAWALLACLGLLPLAALAEPAQENLNVPIPEEYILGFEHDTPGLFMLEYVPEGQSVDNWTDMITIQTLKLRSDLNPRQFERDQVAGWLEACPDAQHQSILSGEENGYPFAFFQLACAKSWVSGHPEYTYIKGIQGSRAFFVAQKAFDRPPTPMEIKYWSKYLRSVILCKTSAPEGSCR